MTPRESIEVTYHVRMLVSLGEVQPVIELCESVLRFPREVISPLVLPELIVTRAHTLARTCETLEELYVLSVDPDELLWARVRAAKAQRTGP